MAIIGNPKYEARINHHLAKYETKRSAVMPLLFIAQEEYGWVNPEGVEEVAQILNLDPTQVKSIAGFYTMYSEKPKGKYWLHVCTDLPCALKGADEFYAWLKEELGVAEGGTSDDGIFTVEHVMCLAACDKAPMLQCNFRYVENLDQDKMRELLAKWRQEAAEPVSAGG